MMIRSKRRGFSLIAVLIVTLCSMLMLGAVMGMSAVFSGASRTTMASDTVYNTLEREVERAKGALKMEMVQRKTPLRRADPDGDIDRLSDLRVTLNGSTFWTVNENVTVGSRSGRLNVEIYDMLYDTAKITAGIPSGERVDLPPAVLELNASGPANGAPSAPGAPVPGGGNGGNTPTSAGVYLIRASIKWDDAAAGESDRRIDVALTQNSNPS